MPHKTTTLVPITDAKTGETLPPGSEVSLNDEDYAAMRANGAVAASEAEQKAGQIQASPEGVYNARVTREDAPAPREEAKKK
jgi:hypothetical protein